MYLAKRIATIALGLVLTITVDTAQGAFRKWTAGAGTSDWFDAANWNFGVPGAADVAVIDGLEYAAGLPDPVINASITLNKIVVKRRGHLTITGAGVVVTVSANLTVNQGASYTDSASLIINQATLTCAANSYIGDPNAPSVASGYVRLENGGTLQQSAGFLRVADDSKFHIVNGTYRHTDNTETIYFLGTSQFVMDAGLFEGCKIRFFEACSILINGGTIDQHAQGGADNLTFGDNTDASNNVTFTMNGGNIIGLEDWTIFFYNADVVINGGTITATQNTSINGHVFFDNWNSAGATFLMTGGTINCGDNFRFQNDFAATFDPVFTGGTVNAPGNFVIRGCTSTSINVTASNTIFNIGENFVVDYSLFGITCNAAPHFPAFNFTMNSGSFTLGGYLENETTGTWNVNGGTLTLDGTGGASQAQRYIQNDGSFNTSGASLMTITSNYEWRGSGTSTIEDFTLNSGNGALLMNQDVSINGDATFMNGLVDISTNNTTLTFGPDATSNIGSASSYIPVDGGGTLEKLYSSATSFNYPIGDADDYSPMTLQFNSGTFGASAKLEVSIDDAKHTFCTGTSPDYLTRHWDVESTDITNPDYSVSLYYTTADVVGTESNIYMHKDNSGSCSYDNVTANDYSNNILNGSFTSFSTLGGEGDSPLPVRWAYINVEPDDDGNEIKWATLSEINNDYFQIQRSVDGIHFETIEVILGAGNSTSLNDYTFKDESSISGTIYYRITQVDFDLYPNPVQDYLTLIFNNDQTEEAQMEIVDVSGKTVLSSKVESGERIRLDNRLKPGVYTLMLKDKKSVRRRKLIKR